MVKIRDFAYPNNDPRHVGEPPQPPPPPTTEWVKSAVVKPDDWTGPARALYDFQPLRPEQVALKHGDLVNIRCKPIPGWLHVVVSIEEEDVVEEKVGVEGGKLVEGLVPEAYLEKLRRWGRNWNPELFDGDEQEGLLEDGGV